MIKKLLLILVSFGMATEWGGSISVRTPNDDTKPLDYELSIKLDDNEGNFRYHIKRDWERELGGKYIDDTANFNHKILKHFYYGVDYVNKESKDINYTTYNIGAVAGGFKAGVAFQDNNPLLNIGFDKKIKKQSLQYIIGISTKSDIGDNNIINVKSEVKKWLSKKVNIFGLYKHEYYNEKEDFQFKVGLGIKL
jgi:hypothetical protein